LDGAACTSFAGFENNPLHPPPIHTHTMMKHTTTCLLGLAALVALTPRETLAQANQLPVSRTAGVLNVSLPINQTSLLALPLVEIIASGTVSTVSGNNLTLASSPTSLPDVMTNPHAIKITSRDDQRGTGTNAPTGSSTNAYGRTAQITAQTGQQVTAVLAAAPNVGDEYVIYRLETLNSLFGTTNIAGLNGASTSANADTVFIESAGNFVGYYYKSTGVGGTGWRTVVGNTAAGTTVVPPNKGLMVTRRNAGSTVTIRVMGDALPGNETATVAAGFNLLNNPFTTSTTLGASFINSFITGSSTAPGADAIYLENAGVVTAYYYKNAGVGGVGWRTVVGNIVSDSVTVAPGKAIVFQEKAGTVGFTLPEPFAE
jgi:hypothetical protein